MALFAGSSALPVRAVIPGAIAPETSGTGATLGLDPRQESNAGTAAFDRMLPLSGTIDPSNVPPMLFEPVNWGPLRNASDVALEASLRAPGFSLGSVNVASQNSRVGVGSNLGSRLIPGTSRQRPNDPFLPKQYWLYNDGQPDESGQIGSPGCGIGDWEEAVRLWKPQREVVLAIVDSGLDLTHEDIDPSILWTNPGESGADAQGRDKATNGVDDDGNGYTDDIHGWNFLKNSPNIQDDHYHGTHVGGLLCAPVGNGRGIAGAFPGLRIMLVKVFGLGNNLSSEKFAEAIRYAVNNGARVLSNSYGTPSFTSSMEEAVRYCHDKGALFVCASGNSRKNMDLEEDKDYPSCYGFENQFVVGATDNRDFSTFSNYGSMVDLAAPGESIFSLFPKNLYRALSGTSQACPLVAGAACFVWSMHPDWSFREVKTRLLESADQIEGLRYYTRDGLRFNLYKAVAGLPGTRLPIEDYSTWHEEALVVETPHPYPNAASLTYDIRVPGAKKVRVHFERLGINHFGDFLTINDPSGTIRQLMNHEMMDLWSDPVLVDQIATVSLRLFLQTNETSTGYGFRIDRIQWLP